jgi:hypothetical protein
MRARFALVFVVLLGALYATAPAALASNHPVLAQSPSGGSSDSGAKGDGAKTDSGDDAKAETPVVEEEGPPWTYQMAKITFAMLFLVFLGMGLSYWKLIGSRQKGTA